MITRLQGKLLAKQPPRLVVDVRGVAYELEAPMTTCYDLPAVGDEVILHTHLLVRSDAHLLFGFSDQQQQHLFRSLIKVNGVGAKVALAILSGMDVDEFRLCVQGSDTARLTRLPGIGKKTAERLVVEMRDRLDDMGEGGASRVDSPTVGSHETKPTRDAINALVTLGYKLQEASKYVLAVASDGMDSEQLIRAALRAAVR